MTGVRSGAAVCSATVSEAILKEDILLHLVLKLASPLQVSLNVDSNKKKRILQLTVGPPTDSSCVLEQRNAILRALVGAALHGALDRAPFYLAGGYAMQFKSPQAAMARGNLTAWMSVADSLRKKASDVAELLPTLDNTLRHSSFLLMTAVCSLADLDLALALLPTFRLDGRNSTGFVSVDRWMVQCLSVLEMYCKAADLQEEAIAMGLVSPPLAAASFNPVTFFTGTEDVNAVLGLLPKYTTASEKKEDGNDSKKAKKESSKDGKEGGENQASNDGKNQKKGEKKKEPKEASKSGGGGDGDDEYDASALDIRVGKIIKVWHHEEAEKLFCEDVDLGTEKRQIASGLRPFYKTEDLQDRRVLVLCNLKKRNLVGFPSHGMVLCASNADHTSVEFVVPPEGAALGERIVFEGLPNKEPEPENKMAKKKIFEKLAPHLKTDANGTVVWKEATATTSAGPVKALNGMPNASVA